MLGPDGVWRGSYLGFVTERDSDELKADGALFLDGEWAHELRFGAGWRETEARSTSVWPGQQLIGRADIQFFPGLYLGLSTTESASAEAVESTDLWLDETLIHGALTARLGLRYDLQEGNNLATTTRPAPLHPDALPGGSFGGQYGGFAWKALSPRLALSWSPGSEGKTTVAMSYARFADQLGTSIAGLVNPVRSGYLYFPWFDANGDLRLTADEVGRFIDLVPGFDIESNPLPDPDPDSIDPDLDAPTTDELTLGVEQRLGRDFLLGLSGTWRRRSGILERERLVQEGFGGSVRTHRASDYEPLAGPAVVVPLPDGTPAHIELYRLRRGFLPTGGVRLENGEREQEALTLTLRGQLFAWHGLRASGQLSWHDWEWQVPTSENEDPTPLVTGEDEDGGAVLVLAASSADDRSDVFLNAGWSYSLAGSYDVAGESAWGVTVGAHLHGREGYPLAYSRTFDLRDGLGARQVLLVRENDAIRQDDMHLVDLRLAKSFAFGPLEAELGVDLFNALDAETVLQRETSLDSARAGAVRETLEPRTVRLGVRLALD